jgi:hypothetical protein
MTNTIKVILPLQYDSIEHEELTIALIDSISSDSIDEYSNTVDSIVESMDEEELSFGTDDYIKFLAEELEVILKPKLEALIPQEILTMLTDEGYYIWELENHYGNTTLVLKMDIPSDD